MKDFNRLMFNKTKHKGKKCFCKTCLQCFKIYADFKCTFKNVDSSINNNEISYIKKYQDHLSYSFAYKVVCVDNRFSKKIVLYRGKNAVNKVIKSIPYEYNYCRRIMRKHFNKNLVMSAEENEKFEITNVCWICDGLIENTDNKVRDHCHSGKYRGASHYSCNINLKITKNVPVIFHNLKGYDSHLIFKELSRFDGLKISVIPNGLEIGQKFN